MQLIPSAVLCLWLFDGVEDFAVLWRGVNCDAKRFDCRALALPGRAGKVKVKTQTLDTVKLTSEALRYDKKGSLMFGEIPVVPLKYSYRMPKRKYLSNVLFTPYITLLRYRVEKSGRVAKVIWRKPHRIRVGNRDLCFLGPQESVSTPSRASICSAVFAQRSLALHVRQTY